MSNLAQDSTARSVSFSRLGSTIECGGTYNPGESLTLSLSNTANHYIFEVSGATVASGGSCSATRTTSSGASVTMPSSGTVTAKAGWSTNNKIVQITPTCTLTAAPPTSSPTASPVTPTAGPTEAPSKSPTLQPTRSPLPDGVTLSPTEAPAAPQQPGDDNVPGGAAARAGGARLGVVTAAGLAVAAAVLV